jgi:serine/threonine-protein kinase
MGIVHLASAQGPGGFHKLLVIKELKPEFSDDETYVSMFLDEARLAARLTHPNIVQTIEAVSEGGRHYMVMEYLDGRSLHGVIRRFGECGGFPVAAHLRVLCETLRGLHYAHELTDFDGQALRVVHRDVSPLNVFVTFEGQAKLLDFGIAKSVDSSLETQAGVLKGRVAYMAPEQASGAKVDRRADVYSTGVMIWEAAAGRRLWPGMNEVQILGRLLKDGPPRLHSVRPSCPPDLEAICARACQKKPEDRYATARELYEDLEAHLAGRGDAMSIREVGELVAAAFAEERRRTSALVEEMLLRVRGGLRSGVMPLLAVHGHGRGTASGLGAVRDEPSEATERSAAGRPVGERPHTWASRVKLLLAMASCALLLPLVGALRVGPKEPAAPLGVPALAPAIQAPAAARDTPDLVDLVVHVSPPGAQVAIDGASIPLNPFHGRFGKDALVHHISASADGYEPKTVDVTFVNDTSIDISLDRHAPAPVVRYVAPSMAVAHSGKHPAPSGAQVAPGSQAASASPPPPSAGDSASAATTPPPSHPDVSPAGGHAPLRPIQTANPYDGQ